MGIIVSSQIERDFGKSVEPRIVFAEGPGPVSCLPADHVPMLAFHYYQCGRTLGCESAAQHEEGIHAEWCTGFDPWHGIKAVGQEVDEFVLLGAEQNQPFLGV